MGHCIPFYQLARREFPHVSAGGWLSPAIAIAISVNLPYYSEVIPRPDPHPHTLSPSTLHSIAGTCSELVQPKQRA